MVAAEHKPQEEVGSNPAGCWPFFTLYCCRNVSLIGPSKSFIIIYIFNPKMDAWDKEAQINKERKTNLKNSNNSNANQPDQLRAEAR